MRDSKPLLIIGQLFMLLAFLWAPIADHRHAIKMLQNEQADTQAAMVEIVHAPCHEATMMDVNTGTPDQALATHSRDKQPCCPYEQCSPNNCLMHLAFVAMPTLEIFPHSPLDRQLFVDAEIRFVTVPATERLRPPIV